MVTTDFSFLGLGQNVEMANRFDSLKMSIDSQKQGWIDMVFDENIVTHVRQATTRFVGITDIVVLGIGGSMLGPKCIRDAFSSLSDSVRVYCVDNIDSDLICDILDNIALATTVFLVQTKSGSTPETLAQYSYVKELLLQVGLSLTEHLIFVTDPELGFLRQEGQELGIAMCDVPPNVGGRFSVLSPIGLVLTELLGLDINQMLQGAQEAVNMHYNSEKSDAFRLATSQYELGQKGKNITVLMPYSSRLATFAQWYTQLLSESIGKKHNKNGNTVHVGLTPVAAVGATDQHSQLQLFVEGPDDKLIVFITVDKPRSVAKIPANLPSSLSYLHNITFDELLKAEFKGTRESLKEAGKSSVTITIPELTPYYLGYLFMFFELSIAFLGELYGINTFDQPGVERSKILTRQNLTSGS